MFGRYTGDIVLDAKHTPHEVRVQQVVASPRVRLLHDFLTEAEAARLLLLAEPLFERSPVRTSPISRPYLAYISPVFPVLYALPALARAQRGQP